MTRASFDLDGAVATVTCRAAYTKNRKASVQPLNGDLVAAMRDHLANKLPNVAAFNMCSASHLPRVLRFDLARASLPYRDEQQCVWDFHAFRHTFITYLDQAGVDPRDMQELARHGSLKMTLHYCQQKVLERKAQVVQMLPIVGHRQTIKAAEHG